MSRRKPAEYELARRLRVQSGMPLRRIAARVGVSVSTVSLWTRDIVLTPEQVQRNLSGPRGPQNPAHVAARVARLRERHRERRRRWQEEGRVRARAGDALHQAGCMLYWAEGSKHRNDVTFCNSDREMLRFFVRFLRDRMGVRSEDITIRLNVYTTNGLPLRRIEDHWLRALQLPRECLRKHQLDHLPTSSSGRKRNKLPYGVCALRVRKSTPLVQHIYGAIQEYGGFDEPAWLD